MKYTFIDVETPNLSGNSICSIALLSVEDDKIISDFYSLVNPQDRFDYINIGIHGIKDSDVQSSPTLLDIWCEISQYFADSIVVAHNANFDISTMRKSLGRYNLELPEINYLCTSNLAQKYIPNLQGVKGFYKLNSLAEKFNIPFENHHNAQCDVTACYQLYQVLIHSCLFSPKSEVQPYIFENKQLKSSFKINFSETTLAMRHLKKIAEDIIVNDTVTMEEAVALYDWLAQNQELKGNYPYDNIFTLCKEILEDGVMDSSEQDTLYSLLEEFSNPLKQRSSNDVISFNEKCFCLSGDFTSGPKQSISNKIFEMGGLCKDTITKATDYLIVGGQGNDSWKFGNYGAKVSRALKMQDKGHRIQILSEDEFLKNFR